MTVPAIISLVTLGVRDVPASTRFYQALGFELSPGSVEGDISHQARTAEILLQVVNGGLPERKVVVNKDLYDQLATSLETARV